MTFLVVSEIMLWIAIAILGAICIALARQIGVLHERIAPAGALILPHQRAAIGKPAPKYSLQSLTGKLVEIGRDNGNRNQLLFFLAPGCPVCKTLLAPLKSIAMAERDWMDIVLASDGPHGDHDAFVRANGLQSFDYVVSEPLGRSFGVSQLPFAALIGRDGTIVSMGLVNSREHIESLFEASERGVSSLQDYLAREATVGSLSGAP